MTGGWRSSARIFVRSSAAVQAVSSTVPRVAVRRRASGPVPALAHTEENRHPEPSNSCRRSARSLLSGSPVTVVTHAVARRPRSPGAGRPRWSSERTSAGSIRAAAHRPIQRSPPPTHATGGRRDRCLQGPSGARHQGICHGAMLWAQGDPSQRGESRIGTRSRSCRAVLLLASSYMQLTAVDSSTSRYKAAGHSVLLLTS